MDTRKVSKGAAMTYTEAALGGPVNEQESTNFAGLPTLMVIGANPDRVGLVLVNAGATDCTVSTSPTSAFGGIALAARGGSMTLTLKDDFTLCSRAWFGLTAGGNTAIYVLEYIRFTDKGHGN